MWDRYTDIRCTNRKVLYVHIHVFLFVRPLFVFNILLKKIIIKIVVDDVIYSTNETTVKVSFFFFLPRILYMGRQIACSIQYYNNL